MLLQYKYGFEDVFRPDRIGPQFGFMQLRSSCVFSEFAVPFHALIVHGSLAHVPWRSAESDPFAQTSAEHMGLRHATVRLKRRKRFPRRPMGRKL